MQQAEYEKAILVASCWQLAMSNDINELLAIACVIRNWVVPRIGRIAHPMKDVPYYTTYSAAIRDFLEIYPTRPIPDVNEPVLIDQDEGLFIKIDEVYNFTMLDLTSSRNNPGGARYFGRATSPSSWFRMGVLAQQDVHKLIGTFGSQQFFE